MAFQYNAELLNLVVQALADSAPSEWRKLIFYFEFLEDEQIGLRNAFTGRVLGGENFEIRLESYKLGKSARTFNLMKALYLEAVQNGDKWTGILFTVLWNGQFKCRLYHDQTPLLADDDAALEQIFSQGMSALP